MNCSNNAGQVSIVRQFNNVNSGQFSIDDGLLGGECTVTSPFSLAGRCVPATASAVFGGVAARISGNDIVLARWSMVTSVGPAAGDDGDVFLLIY
ncbi:MAG: hypothetical protein AB1689_12840 [Thermodesulfobacteriota bacterium]